MKKKSSQKGFKRASPSHLIIVVGVMVAAISAIAIGISHENKSSAADTGCGTHQLAVNSWSVQTDVVNTSWHFKCGGANNWNYRISPLALQYRDSSGAWHTFNCDNGSACSTSRPTSGSYSGGSDHSGTNTWNVAGNINCKDIRFHAQVSFTTLGSLLTKNYNSLTYHIGC